VQKLIRFDWAIKNILRQKVNFAILEGFLSELLQDVNGEANARKFGACYMIPSAQA